MKILSLGKTLFFHLLSRLVHIHRQAFLGGANVWAQFVLVFSFVQTEQKRKTLFLHGLRNWGPWAIFFSAQCRWLYLHQWATHSDLEDVLFQPRVSHVPLSTERYMVRVRERYIRGTRNTVSWSPSCKCKEEKWGTEEVRRWWHSEHRNPKKKLYHGD